MTIIRERCTKEDLIMKLEGGDGAAFLGAYEAVLNLIKTKEKHAFEEYHEACKRLKAQEQPYPRILEQIGDVVERITEVYIAAHAFKVGFFEPLLSEMDLRRSKVAELKCPFRVLEKELLRPGCSVPWDVVRGQVE